MSKHVVITIAREYGSGGSKIGQRVAEELGIGYYDNEMLSVVSDASIFSDEDSYTVSRIKNTTLYSIAKEAYNLYKDKGIALKGNSTDDMRKELFEYQSYIIKRLAESESCVIMGRCANYILRDLDPNETEVIKLFIYAPIEFRKNRKSLTHHMSDAELTARVKTMDRHKAEYYKFYTGVDWSDVRYYDASIDSAKLGITGSVEKIIKLVNNR